MSKFRPTAILYAALTLVFISCAIVLIVKQNGSDRQNYFQNQRIEGKKETDSGEDGRSNPLLAPQDYYNKLCELDR